eukprot:TRINITY_DN4056_c0_g1_i1.p2 TRINITY_DN4056_c0_g1~~TRINITY_DN4056_c0_g1_i1.p2  ORF type:complete len:159 (+),score=68.61 TRINITY_DN4056_c0_g1_i1:86-562(+)
MGRRGGSRKSSTTTSSRPASSSSNTPAPRTSAPPQKQTTQSQPQQPHTPPPQTVVVNQGGGGGMLGNIASMAAGSFIGHVVADKFLNKDGQEQEQQVPQNAPAQPAYEQQNQECVFPQQNWAQCMRQNKDSISQCQWAYDMFQQCLKDPVAFKNNNYI